MYQWFSVLSVIHLWRQCSELREYLFICLGSQEYSSLLIACIAVTYDCLLKIFSMLNIGLSLKWSED